MSLKTESNSKHGPAGTGMKTLLAMNKEIDEKNAESPSNSKIVKLRFTRKQYQTFRDACKIFEVVSSDPEFTQFVQKSLGTDIKVPTIARQLVTPIVEAPLYIPMKLPKSDPTTRKESYFTARKPVTEKATMLYSKVAKEMTGIMRYDLKEGSTCITDVRVMISKYFESNNLNKDHGKIVDDFLFKLAPRELSKHKGRLVTIDKKTIIPKGDTKVVMSIINEVTFDSDK
jgi:hypothetical protein